MFRKFLPLDDLRSFFQSRSRAQLWAAGLSVLITITVMTGFLIENRSGYLKPDPLLVYMENWPANRSLAEVKARQAEELAARMAAIEAQKTEEAQKAETAKAVVKTKAGPGA